MRNSQPGSGLPMVPILVASAVFTVPTEADSLMPYPSYTGTPAAWKNSRISAAMGAAPEMATRIRPPNAARTLLNSWVSASSKPRRSSSGTGSPACSSRRTASPAATAGASIWGDTWVASAAYTFSKIRGTEGRHVGRSSAQSGRMADAAPLLYATTPPVALTASCTTWAKACARGRNR